MYKNPHDIHYYTEEQREREREREIERDYTLTIDTCSRVVSAHRSNESRDNRSSMRDYTIRRTTQSHTRPITRSRVSSQRKRAGGREKERERTRHTR